MRRWPIVLLVLLVGAALIGTVVLAANGPAQGRGKGAAILTDKSWANRVPDAAPEIKKIQALYAEDPTMGRLAAVGALSSQYGVVRTYGALVLGAIGEADQLEPLAKALAAEGEPAVQAELALAQVQIKHRLAAGHAEKQASVLAEAEQSGYDSVRSWAQAQAKGGE